MDGAEREQKAFMSYEYKEVTADGSRLSFLLDGYENFGWEMDERLMEKGKNADLVYQSKKATLRLKRNRKIINKAELTRLQRNFEACVDEIDRMEKEKTSAAAMYALVLGIIGTAFMAGATFAATAQPPQYILCIVLAIPGFLGWILPPFLYRKAAEKRTKKVIPLIEAKYDEIYEICEKGNKLLY